MTHVHFLRLGLISGLLLLLILTPSLSSRHPNFVLILTDDLDKNLGGSASLTKTKRILTDEGADLPNWFVQTPICCASRAELLTGRMLHNLKVPTFETPGCMHVDVTADPSCSFYKKYYFARHFSELGYTVGVFGKHLNSENPESPPPDVDRWMVNGGGAYLDPQFNWASAGVEPSIAHFNNCTNTTGAPCYSTSVIGNSSIDWIRDHVTSFTDDSNYKPFFAYVSVKAPHIQDGPVWPISTPAPWYTNASVSTMYAPRTPNYNASCQDHHWLIKMQPPITDLEESKIDGLYVSRLRSLLSVDDLVEDMVGALENLGVLNNTYILFTSDNGYQFGQFRLPQGKWQPYENDIRVPFMIRGPGIRPGSILGDILGSHVDVMPTLLGLVQKNIGSVKDVPSTMDGICFANELIFNGTATKNHHRQRTSLLIEYISMGNVTKYSHLEDFYNSTFRALRVIDRTQPEGIQNLKYVEFTDSRQDWNFTKEPLDFELFDLDSDPFELVNLAFGAPRDLTSRLRDITRKLFTCAGKSCRDTDFLRINDDMLSAYQD